MYIGKFQPHIYQSFATNNCVKTGNIYTWNGIDGTASGISCAQARQNYCIKYGVNGKCYGDPGAPPHDPAPSSSKPPAPTGGGGGTPASDKCGGCDAGNIGCELGKLSCEASNWFNDSGGNIFGDPKKLLMIGGGALVLILLLTRR